MIPPTTSIQVSQTITDDERADHFTQYFPPIATCGSKWRMFSPDEGTWQIVSRDVLRPHAQAIFAKSLRTAAHEKNLLDLVEGRFQRDEKFFKGALMFEPGRLDAVLVNVPNGILKVTADVIEMREHDQRLGFTRALGAKYEKGAVNADFVRVLNHSLPDVLDKHLFKCGMGNLLVPDCRMECVMVLLGEAKTGKDTIIVPIIYALDGGEVARGTVTYLNLAQICDSNCYALAKLKYSCVNICNELDAVAVEESANFKKLVSGFPTEAREIKQAPFTMTPHCKIVALSNEMPQFKHGTNAEVRRMRFLPFNRVITAEETDVTLKERLKVACPGVLNFILEGLQEVLRLKGKQMPLGGAEAQAIHSRFATSNDPLGDFVKGHCEMDKSAVTACADLQMAFNGYADSQGFPEGMNKTFMKKLYNRFTNLKTSREGDGLRRRVVAGIKLKESGYVLVEAARHEGLGDITGGAA